MTETALSKAIREALTARGFMVCRIQSGILQVASVTGPRFIHCAPAGTPDIFCSVAGGVFFEVKLPGKKLTSAQQEWHKRAARDGVRVATVSSVKEALQVARAYQATERRTG